MQLVIRNSKGDGLQAYVFPEDGEVNCPGACQLLVRVDDAPPKSFAVTVRRFEFSYRLDFADPSALVQHIRYAKRLRVLLRYLDIPGNKNKGDVVWTVNPEAPLVVRPLRKAVQ
ncbi:MAG: hypothetical protein JSR75_21525 [Proteobacteria bacterium]|nr:hypothetical protein [Pseudomonadota bacterium]